MSYRSKRTRADTAKDEDAQVLKKVTSSEALSAREAGVALGLDSEIWGPFCPPESGDKEPRNCTDEAHYMKRQMLQQPNKGQHFPNQNAQLQKYQITPASQANALSKRSNNSTFKKVSASGNVTSKVDHIEHVQEVTKMTSTVPQSPKGYTGLSTFKKATASPSLNYKVSENQQGLDVSKSSPIWKNPPTEVQKQKHSFVGQGTLRTLLRKITSNASLGLSSRTANGAQAPTTTTMHTVNQIPARIPSTLPSSTLLTSTESPKAVPMNFTSSLHSEVSRPQLRNLKPKASMKKGSSPLNDVKMAPNAEKTALPPKDKGFGLENNQIGSIGSQVFKPRRRSLIPEWPDNVEFDEKEEIVAIDMEGQYQKNSAPIRPHDVWHANGLKYFVLFNEFYQPLKRGGHILIKLIGDIARSERFCPIRETNWRHVNAQYKVDIIKTIRGHFVIPEGESYDQGILKRVGKSVRQYRHYLKAAFFKPKKKTKTQIYDDGPSGHPRDSWINLVDYWYSEKGTRFAEYGREARASQTHVHTTGSTSYANIRADFEENNKREPSHLELFGRTHRRKDGTFIKDTVTEDLLMDVEANAQTQMDFHPSSAKSRVQYENESFNKLMYRDEVPKPPVGYAFGVKQSDVFGVSGILRKEGFNNSENNVVALQNLEKVVADLKEENKELVRKQEDISGLIKEHRELKTKNEQNSQLLKTMTTQFCKILDVLSTGNAPTEVFNLAKNFLHLANSQDEDIDIDQGATDDS